MVLGNFWDSILQGLLAPGVFHPSFAARVRLGQPYTLTKIQLSKQCVFLLYNTIKYPIRLFLANFFWWASKTFPGTDWSKHYVSCTPQLLLTLWVCSICWLSGPADLWVGSLLLLSATAITGELQTSRNDILSLTFTLACFIVFMLFAEMSGTLKHQKKRNVSTFQNKYKVSTNSLNDSLVSTGYRILWGIRYWRV